MLGGLKDLDPGDDDQGDDDHLGRHPPNIERQHSQSYHTLGDCTSGAGLGLSTLQYTWINQHYTM